MPKRTQKRLTFVITLKWFRSLSRNNLWFYLDGSCAVLYRYICTYVHMCTSVCICICIYISELYSSRAHCNLIIDSSPTWTFCGWWLTRRNRGNSWIYIYNVSYALKLHNFVNTYISQLCVAASLVPQHKNRCGGVLSTDRN